MTDHERAIEWLHSYHGSIDSTALILAFKAGVAHGREATFYEVRTLDNLMTSIEQLIDVSREAGIPDDEIKQKVCAVIATGFGEEAARECAAVLDGD